MKTADLALLGVGAVLVIAIAIVALIEHEVYMRRRADDAPPLPVNELAGPPRRGVPLTSRQRRVLEDALNAPGARDVELPRSRTSTPDDIRAKVFPPDVSSIPELPDQRLQPAPDKSWLETEGPRHRRGRYRS